jgi:hypothetical protein
MNTTTYTKKLTFSARPKNRMNSEVPAGGDMIFTGLGDFFDQRKTKRALCKKRV